jgi:methylated-DNA-protein-cysteine methyltransferase-like protein
MYEQIYEVIRRIPPGRVATYGQIARLAGMPRDARTVGWALRAMPEGSDVPWQRVINAQGRISFRPGSEGAALQQAMLEDEGIVFDRDGRVNLKVYGWEGLDLAERHELLAGSAPDGEPHAQQLSFGL